MKKIYNRFKNKYPLLVIAITMLLIVIASYGTIKFFSTANKKELLAVGTNYERTADPNTMDDYLTVLNLENNSRNAGRVWSDKTVFASGYESKDFANNTLTLDIATDGVDGYVQTDTDFLHVFSTIGSSQVVNEVATKPLDVVLLLDISTSMTDNSNSDPLHQMLNDANELIDNLMNGTDDLSVHSDNRVGVVVYGGGTQILMPLDHYSKDGNSSYLTAQESLSGTHYFPVITTHAKATHNSFQNVTSKYMYGDSTYLQGALYQGFNMLINEKDTTYKSGSEDVSRTPILIVLSDGGTNVLTANSATGTMYGYLSAASTGSSANNNAGNIGNGKYWYEPYIGIIPSYNSSTLHWPLQGNPLYGSIDGDQGKNLRKPLMISNLLLAGYLQKKVEAHYNQNMQGYSIMLNTENLGLGQKELMYTTLAPANYLNANSSGPAANVAGESQNVAYQDTRDTYNWFVNNYLKNGNTTVTGNTTWYSGGGINGTWNFIHPKDTENDIKSISDLYYIDKAYKASSGDLSDIFDQIFEEITGITFSPVGGENASGVSDSLTYMDPIGEYMEIKDKSITLSDGNKYDLGLTLFGEMHGLVKTAVYDFQWNDNYMRNENNGTSGLLFSAGWFKGTPELTNNKTGNKDVFYGGNGAVPDKGNYKSNEVDKAWADGWVYRIPWNIAVQYVSTLQADNFDEITDTQKHTVYTIYRFDKNISEGVTEDSEYRNTPRLNPCYEKSANVTYLLSDIRVWVEDTKSFQDTSSGSTIDFDFDEAIYVNIPVNALPIQVATITLDADGNVHSYNTNLGNPNLDDASYKAAKAQSTPFRLFYGVGVQEEIMTDDGLDIDAGKLSSEYIQEHSQKSSEDPSEDEIYFLSNYYSNTPYEGYINGTRPSYTRGDPNFTFSPATDNRYYVFQKPLILYKYNGTPKDNYEEIALDTENDYQEFLTKHENDKVTTNTDISKDSYYWIVGEYYTKDKKIVHLAVTRKGGEFGSEIGGDEVSYSDYLVWYNPVTDETKPFNRNEASPGNQYVVATKKGGLRIGNMLNGRRQKDDNTTSTAYNYYIPTVSEQSTGDNLIINGYLGNNGKLVIPNTTLEITKEVEAVVGTDYSEEEFNYELYIADRVGDFSAVNMIRSPFADNLWQLRISTIDVLTSNEGLLQKVVENDGSGHTHSLYMITIGNNDYYVYVGGDGSDASYTIALDGVASEDDPYSFRLYDASDTNYEKLKGVGRTNYVTDLSKYKSTDNIKYVPATDDKPAGTIEFWIADAYLIPATEVDDKEWHFDIPNSYQKVGSPIVVSTLNPYERGRDQLTSEFATDSLYGTTTLYFGYGGVPEGISQPAGMSTDDWEWLTDPKNANKAKFTLKDGEGIFLAGLPKSTKYTIYEKITPEQAANGYDFGYIYGSNGQKYTNVQNNEPGVYEQSSGGYSGQRDLHIVNTYYAHYDLVLDKSVLGTNGETDIKNEKLWNFTIKLTPSIVEGSNATFATEYEYYGPCTDLETCSINSEKLKFTENEDGTYTVTVSLKHNEKIKIINILADTKYEITEVEANQDGYESYTNNEKGYDEATGEFDADKHIGMINANWKRYDLTLRKTVLGSGGSKTRDFTFKVTLTPLSDVRLAESYPYEGSKTGDMKFTKNSNANSYTGTIKLKDSEYITIKGLPENVTYEVVEVEANENGYVTTIPTNYTGTLNGDGTTVDVQFINGKYELHDLTLEKIVRGATGSKNKEWTFEVTLEPGAGIIIQDKYSYVGTSIVDGVEAPANGTITFTKQSNGSYLGTVKLKHGQAITIKDIPENTRYTVEEVEADKDGYTTSDSGNTNGIVDDQHVRFTNKMLEKVDLSISKEVKGDNANLNLDWKFEITLIPGADDINSPYSYIGESFITGVTAPENGKLDFTDNGDGTYKATITLKHGQKITIQDLSETTKYTVKELGANTDGYFTSSTDNKTGILGSENIEVKFVNELLPNSSLTIAKEVLGSAGNPKKDWTFQIDLTPVAGTVFKTTYDYVGRTIVDRFSKPADSYLKFTDTDGDGTYTATITLIHGQAITILDLPTGTQFKVSEVEANTDGYRTSTNREVTGTIDGATVADIIVYSNIKTINYDLRLSKQVVGTLGDKDKDWLFNIRLIPDEYGVISSFDYDGSKDGTLNFVRQDDGSYLATISLKHNEYIFIRGIPENTRYSIEEVESNQDGYVTHVTNNNATDFLTKNDVSVDFVNTKFDDFNLMLKKTVKGSLGDKTKEWNFRIEFVRPEYEELERQYKYSKSTIDSSGNVVEETGFIEVSPVENSLNRYEAFIKLKHGESLTILGLPEGTDYTITEDEANQDGYETSMTNNNMCTLVSDEVVEFTNSKYLKYDLTIEKVVTGIGDKNKDWNFDITLTPMNGLLLNNTYNYVGSKTGTITFTRNEDGTYTGRITLKHGESVTIQDLPEDTRYSVTEVEANQDGYETTAQNESGELNKDGIKVIYTNFKEEPPTGNVTPPPPHTGVEVSNTKLDYIVETLLLITYLIISIKVLKRI